MIICHYALQKLLMPPYPMALAPWRSSLARALHRNRSQPHSRYLQLATTRPDGSPANRTVVFRGFLAEGDNRLIITADARTQKIAQIQANPAAEACWYFPQSREQFRLTGQLAMVDAQEPDSTLQAARQSTWQGLSDKARQQFTWPHPGEIREPSGFAVPAPSAAAPVPQFCLLLLTPCAVDHLELRGDPQTRHTYISQADGGWQHRNVNP